MTVSAGNALILERTLGSASARFDGATLSVFTGAVERAWRVIPAGLATVRFRRLNGGREWIAAGGQPACDWRLIGVLDGCSQGRLGPVAIEPIRDSPYTADHLQVEVPVAYEADGVEVCYRIWVYPGACGIRTQLRVRSFGEAPPAGVPGYLGPSYAERLALAGPVRHGRAAGYYNDTQHRNYDETPILRETPVEVRRNETIDWASLIQLQGDDGCLTLVQESHKCVNQSGVDTGAFVIAPTEVRVAGLCLSDNIYGGGTPCHWRRAGRFRDCWAVWSILTPGGFDEARAGLKGFDRLRFPFRPGRDAMIMANTWGSRGAGEGSRTAAEQANVLRELDSCADLGIDLLQIDDGWQCEPGAAKPFDVDWTPNPTRFPDGWRTVRAAAERLGVALGLWQPWWVPLETILQNHAAGGFRRYKLDFMGLFNADQVETALDKGRDLFARTGCGINWDATEVHARMGYFLGRDCGNIYLANRPSRPAEQRHGRHVAYNPHLALRDAWHLARYLNLNQVQLTVQNHDRVDSAFSNAHRHGADYGFAITIMGVPIFFQETHLLADPARALLRPLVALYKRHRARLFEGFVEPVGAEPDDASWTGFHNAHPDGRDGYLTLIREIGNDRPDSPVAVPTLAGQRLRLTDLVSGTTRDIAVAGDGVVPARIGQPAGFLFLRYERI